MWAEVTRPGGSSVTVTLAADHPGEFSGSFPADRPGVYAIRVRARGRTRVGRPFTREQTVTAAVWRGGDVVVDPGSGGPGDPGHGGHGDDCLCSLLWCLLSNGFVDERLEKHLQGLGIDLDVARKCLKKCLGRGGDQRLR